MFDVTKSLNENWDKIDEYVYNQEADRQANEIQRQENEEERQTQEKTRETNEETRKENETKREDNETQREENEQAREEYIEQLKEQVLNGEVGNGIKSYELVEGNHKAGTFDVYKITFTDGTIKDIQVYNGRDGTGAGDMVKATYDINEDGIVDNAEKVNNHTVETDVPANAVFLNEKDKEKLDKITQEVVIVEEAIPANTEYEIPFSYIVGSNELEVKWLGWPCTKDVNFAEVGEPGAESNKVNFGWQIEPNEILEFRKRG